MINPSWLPDTSYSTACSAPRDGTVVEVLPEIAGYVPPKRARFGAVDCWRLEFGDYRLCDWIDDNGRFGFSVGYWRPVTEKINVA